MQQIHPTYKSVSGSPVLIEGAPVGWMDGWMLFNDTLAQFRPFSVLERFRIKYLYKKVNKPDRPSWMGV